MTAKTQKRRTAAGGEGEGVGAGCTKSLSTLRHCILINSIHVDGLSLKICNSHVRV